MGVTRTLAPDHERLVPLERFQAEIEGDDCDFDSVLAAQHLDDASSRVETLLGRPLVRAQYTETLRGGRCSQLILRVRPIAKIVAISYRGTAQDVTEFEIVDSEAGIISRTLGGYPGWFESGYISPGWSVTTVAGYFVPDDDFSGSISVAASDDSYNSTGFPTHLVAGDEIRPQGFTVAVNKLPKSVVSATTSKIITASALADEAVANHRIDVSNVPGAITAAVLLLAKESYENRASASGSGPLTSERIEGVSSLTWASRVNASSSGQSSTAREASSLLFPFQDF